MDHKTIEKYLLSFPDTRLDYPFGEEAAVYQVFIPAKPVASHASRGQGDTEQHSESYQSYEERAAQEATQPSAARTDSGSGSARKQDSSVRGDWKMFALVAEGKEPVRLSLKCDPQLAVLLRNKYETVLEGYHLNKKHWNTILLTGQLPWEEVQPLIRHSYDLVTKADTDIPEMPA